MVGHKLGEFSPTRTFNGHTPADKKAAQSTPTTSSNKPAVTSSNTPTKDSSNAKK